MSRMFAAYSRSLEIVTTVSERHAVRVLDGPTDVNQSVKKFVMLGVDDVAAIANGRPQLAIDAGVQEWLAIGAYDKRERFTIYGVFVTWDGRVDFAARRAEAQEYFDDLEAAFMPHDPLGGTLSGAADGLGYSGVANVMPSRWQYQRTEGAGLHVQFQIQCDTYPTQE